MDEILNKAIICNLSEHRLQRCILENKIPISINGITYKPLCAEMAEIDLVFIADNGYLLLVECKNKFPKSFRTKIMKSTINQIKHRPIDQNENFFIHLKIHLEKKQSSGEEWKVPSDAANCYEAWRAKAKINETTKLFEMLEQGRLHLAIVAQGILPEDIKPSPFLSLISADFSLNLIIKKNQVDIKNSQQIWHDWKEGFEEYTRIKRKKRKNNKLLTA